MSDAQKALHGRAFLSALREESGAGGGGEARDEYKERELRFRRSVPRARYPPLSFGALVRCPLSSSRAGTGSSNRDPARFRSAG